MRIKSAWNLKTLGEFIKMPVLSKSSSKLQEDGLSTQAAGVPGSHIQLLVELFSFHSISVSNVYL